MFHLRPWESPCGRHDRECAPLRGRIPHVAWLRIKEVSRFPVSQRCAERNMVEVRTRADAQVHFGKKRCFPRRNRSQRRQSTTTSAHWQGRLPSHGRRFHRWMQLNHLPSMYYAKDTKSYAESLSRFHVGMLRSEIARKSNDRFGVWRPWHERGALLRDRFTVPWRNRG